MFKLMKYEFRKMRTVLGIMCLALVALEIGFIAGNRLNNPEVMGISLGLLMMLTFAAYLYVLLAGISSYARELNDKTGYMVFMAPVTPAAVVASKLIFTILTALVMGALFGGAAFYDLTVLFKDMDWDPRVYQQVNEAFRIYAGNGQLSLTGLLLNIGVIAATVIIEVMSVMCASYLAITLAATLLQNKKGFWRFLLSLVLFFALQYGMNAVKDLVLGTPSAQNMQEAASYLGLDLAVEGGFCVLFAAASAVLLDRKVSL